MKTNWKQIVIAGSILVLTAPFVLTGCTGSVDEAQITDLESQIKANTDAIAALQQQVQAQSTRIDGLTPSFTISTPTPTPTTPPVVTPPANPNNIIASSNIQLGALTVSPAEAITGQTVTISLQVTNKGATDGNSKVVIFETNNLGGSDVVEYLNTVPLKAGETTTITFTTTKAAPGSYSLQSGEKIAGYIVTAH